MPQVVYSKEEVDALIANHMHDHPCCPIPPDDRLKPANEPAANWTGDSPLVKLPSMTSDKGFSVDATWTRQVAVLKPGWAPFQGRWYKNDDLDNPIGSEPTENFTGEVAEGDRIKFLEWFRNDANGEIFIAESGDFGPLQPAAPAPAPAPAPEPAPAPPPPAPSSVVNDIIASMRAHEMKPYAGRRNDDGVSGWKNIPWQVVQSSKFKLHGSVLMPPWGNFDRRAWLMSQPWNRISAWNQLFHLVASNALGTSLHKAFGTAAMLSNHDVLCWHGGNKYTRPFGPPTDRTGWMAGFWYDFRGNATLEAAQKEFDGKTVIKPSNNGQQVFHGGSPGARDVGDWQTVRGVIVRSAVQLVNWDGSPVTDEQERNSYLGFSVGCDAHPPGTGTNTHFQPAGYIPGIGCGGFIRVTRQKRFAYFCTLTAEELKAYPPPL